MNYLVSNDTRKLYKALLSLVNEEECKKFLRDLLTKEEIQEFVNRFKVAQMLDKKISYKKIEKETGMSSTTIARVSKWLAKGMGGYRLVIDRLNNPVAPVKYSEATKTQAQTDTQNQDQNTPKSGVIFAA